MSGKVLLVDDDPDIFELMGERLRRHGYDVVVRQSGEQALQSAERNHFDLVVSDLMLPGIGGVEVCRRLRESCPDVPVIVITAFGSMQTAIEALRAGAVDFVLKPISLDHFVLTVERTIGHRRLREEVRRLREIVAQLSDGEIVGQSACMLETKRQVQRVARTDASVLITGESGTGKEVIAQALHLASSRREGPLVSVNCGALPEQLVEAELFGHVRGAFTDASSARTGLFLAATGGTIFLDEVGELPLALQVKLLRVLQERMIRPVGSVSEVPVDVRVITATNRDLSSLVQAGQFREDLFFRLDVINISVPPLRARGNDILLLAQHFVDRFAKKLGKSVTGLMAATAERLLAYDWPGNVRELQNCMERAVALTEYDRLTVDDLPEQLRTLPLPALMLPAGGDVGALPALEEMEQRYIKHVLDLVGGNKSMAARILGVDRRTLHRKVPSDGGAET